MVKVWLGGLGAIVVIVLATLFWPFMGYRFFAAFLLGAVLVCSWAFLRIMPMARVREGRLEVKSGTRVLSPRWKRRSLDEVTRLEVVRGSYVVWFGGRALRFSRRFEVVAREIEARSGLRFPADS